MDRLATYALVAAIGEITKPTREERNREGDRWVALRSLDPGACLAGGYACRTAPARSCTPPRLCHRN